jgi:hypothetical protein
MKTLGFLLCVLIGLALPGCNLAERYQQNNAATAQWIDAKAGIPKINISGAWQSDDWGDAVLTQKGNRVTGYVGKYPIGGSIKDHTVYLAITDDGWTYYTAVLQADFPVRTLTGFYSDEVPFNAEDQNEMILTRNRR